MCFNVLSKASIIIFVVIFIIFRVKLLPSSVGLLPACCLGYHVFWYPLKLSIVVSSHRQDDNDDNSEEAACDHKLNALILSNLSRKIDEFLFGLLEHTFYIIGQIINFIQLFNMFLLFH